MTTYGMPIWYELITPDIEKAKTFYGDIVGWTTTSFPGLGGEPYTIWNADGAGIGGVVTVPDWTSGPTWLAYFHVADVDAKSADVAAAGGKILMPAQDIPMVGRIALVEDAQGVLFYLMRPDPAMEGHENVSYSATKLGSCSWNELVVPDQKKALPFYKDLLGWVSNEAMPMGPMGDYSFLDVGDTRIGAVMDRSAPEQPVKFIFYFAIPDVDAAVDKVKAGGGSIIMGPMDVPGGQRIILCIDPTGASVGFVSGERA
ncbi:VOC family protein [Sphingomonas immobilis]|uniref:VOC family protein n=1 Tax=Sphingomonas immobilis TaxID=3063997 RepID=A0ABT9A1L6_9SPHN|nr:VOC family protein [Sphingomonas sp. CA1-15]MDO7843719.1 VOC family protein [Sphingomonas sp. CA1-15]